MFPITKSVIYFLIVLCVSSFNAQELYFQSLAAKLNLPSDECYNIMQDRQGYLWIGTENGLCRYNGNSVKIYNSKNGLPERKVYFLKEGLRHEITLITSSGRIAKIENDSVKEVSFSKKISDFRKAYNDDNVIYNLTRLQNEDLIVSGYSFTYRISESGNVSLAVEEGSMRRRGYENVDFRNSHPFVVKDKRKKPVRGLKKNKQNIDFIFKDTVVSVPFKFELGYLDGDRVLICENDSQFFISKGTNLFRINKYTYKIASTSFPSAILHMSNQSGALCIGLRKAGMRYYPVAGDMKNFKKGLEGYSVSGICVDREGAVWCTTLEKNVFYCKTIAVTDYSNIKELSTRTSFMKGIGDSLILSTKFDELLIFCNSKLKRIVSPKTRSGEMTDALRFNGHWFICSKGYFLKTDKFLSKSTQISHGIRKNAVSVLQVDTFAGKMGVLAANDVSYVVGDRCGYNEVALKSKAKAFLFCSEDCCMWDA